MWQKVPGYILGDIYSIVHISDVSRLLHQLKQWLSYILELQTIAAEHAIIG